jgi:hypothetical protein
MAEFKFLADIHVSLAAIEALRHKGIEVIRTLDVGFDERETDEVLLEYATQQKLVLITCDLGFERRCYQWKAEERDHASILYLSMSSGYCQDIGLIMEWVEMIYGAADPEREYFNEIWRAK